MQLFRYDLKLFEVTLTKEVKETEASTLVGDKHRHGSSYRHQFVPVLHEVMYRHQTLSYGRVVMTTEGVSSHKQLCKYCIVLDTQRDDVRKLCKQMYCFQSFMFGHAQQQYLKFFVSI